MECAEVLVSLSEMVKMNLDKVTEKECTKVLCSLSKSVETEENPSFFKAVDRCLTVRLSLKKQCAQKVIQK